MATYSAPRIQDLPALNDAGKFAILVIDNEYLFHKLNSFQAPEILKDFSAFSTRLTQHIPLLRAANIPLIHVAYDLNYSADYLDLDTTDRRDVDAHCVTFIQNKDDLTVRRAKKDSVLGNNEHLIRTDILHEIKDGERVFLKRDCSALAPEDAALKKILKRDGIDTLGTMGAYLQFCVGETVDDGHKNDFRMLGVTDMIYGYNPNKADRVTAYFKANFPAAACTDMEELSWVFDRELTP